MNMRVMGLFAGVGGLELGLERAGHEARVLCELEPAAQHVLMRRFRHAFVQDDVRSITCVPSDVDLLTAGFPCQDLSQAGQMAGIHGKNSGLVEHVFATMQGGRLPQWVLLENVPNMLRLHGGRAMRHIVRRLDALGYRWAYRLIDSRAFGLPQRRNRVFLLASLELDPAPILLGDSHTSLWPADDQELDADAYGFYWTEGNAGLGWSKESVPPLKGGSGLHIPSAPAIWLPRATRGPAIVTPCIEDAERLQGFPSGWTCLGKSFPVRRRWRLVGNAVTVPVATWIGRRLATPTAFGRVEGTHYTAGRLPSAAFGGRGQWFASNASPTPVARKPRLLSEFIDLDATDALSPRATAGFHSRLLRSTLTAPPEFKEALRAHIERHARNAA